MNGLFSRLTPAKRLGLAIGLIGLVHLGLLRFGNEDATPLKLLGSFALSAALLLTATAIKKNLLQSSSSRDPR